MKRLNLFAAILFICTLSTSMSVAQCINCFEGPTTVFAGQTAYYYWGGTPGGVWYVTNATPGVIGTPSQSSEILSIPILGSGGFSITHDNANGTQVNVIAWAVPGAPDDPYIESTQCDRITISMRTQNKPSDVDWYWVDTYKNFVSISPSIDVYSGSTYYVQSRSHDHPEIIGGISQPINITMPYKPVDGVIMANNSTAPMTVCSGEAILISSYGGEGVPHYWASANGVVSPDAFADKHVGERSFAFRTWVAGTYTFLLRNRADVCGFCWDTGNCNSNPTVTVTVLPAANSGELFLNNADRDVCVGTRIPVKLLNNVGTAYYNVYYTKDTNKDGKLDTVSVEDTSNLGVSFEYPISDYGEWYFEYWSQACGQNSIHNISSISVWDLPGAPKFSGPDPIICPGESLDIQVSPGYPGTGVRWYDSPLATVSLNAYPYNEKFSTGSLNHSRSFWLATYKEFGPTRGCEGQRFEYFVPVSERPVDSDITASAMSICLGESVRISTTGGIGIRHFYCSTDGSDAWNVFNDAYRGLNQFDHTPDKPGTYKYRVRNSTECGYCGDPGNNCGEEKSVIVVVSARPVAGNIIGQKNVLFGQPYSYSVPQASLHASEFTWVVNGGSIVSGQGTPRVKANFSQSGGSISVTVTNGNCTAIDVPSLTVAEGGNYVADETILVPGIKDPAATGGLNEDSKSKITAFYDALGRPVQTVNWRSSPDRKDIVVHSVYDKQGREPLKYLPFTANDDGYYKSDPVGNRESPYAKSPQHNYYDGRMPNVAIDDMPVIATVFELSPLNRVLKQGSAGTSWQPDSTKQYDRTTKLKYLLNNANEVCRFIFSSSTGIVPWTPAANGYYPANVLVALKTIDENNNETIEYTDKLSRKVCKKVQYGIQAGVKLYACTYYVYDDFQNLAVVLPPEAVKQVMEKASLIAGGTRAGTAALAAILDGYAFRYRYDSKNRMSHKKKPGAGWMYMVYDDRDRLVLTQDANQRSTATSYWTFMKYDRLNRPIMTGIRDTVAISQEVMQSVVDYHCIRQTSKSYESFIGSANGNVHGYSNNSYPVCTGNVPGEVDPNKYLTVTYYDNYAFRSLWPGNYRYIDEGLTESANGQTYRKPHEPSSAIGQVTGTKIKVLDGGPTGGYTWLGSVTYFDDRYRVIQISADNYKGGVDVTSNVNDFTGKLLKSKTTHTERDPTWKDVVGAALIGNRLYKNTTQPDRWGNSGAASIQQLPAGQSGWIQFITTEPSTSRVLGLSAVNVDADFTSIDYAFHQDAGNLLIVERGAQKKSLGSFRPGEVLYIVRSGSNIVYLRNGVVVYRSDVLSTGPLMIDVALYSKGATLAGVTASFSTTSHVVTCRYVYDQRGRLFDVRHRVDTNHEIILVRNSYNELGQLVDKNLRAISSDSRARQSIDYRYNIRGWIKSINNSRLISDGGITNDDTNDLFGMELAYDNSLGTGNAALYNGNIGGIKWSTNLALGAVKDVAYNYSYDPMGRLRDARYLKNRSGHWANWNRAFNESGYEYDLNGNITRLARRDHAGMLMDSLSYTYGNAGNQLLKISDAGDKTRGFVEPASTSGNDYSYDANGNVTRDKNKGITAISYNFLNLPETVSKGSNKIYYSYDALGHKLSQNLLAGKLKKASDYVGEYFYQNDTLQFINNEEGRIAMVRHWSETPQLLDFSACNNAAAFTQYGTLSMTISNFISGEGDTYVKMVSNVNSSSAPGMVSSLVSVTPGQRYQLRMRAYCPSNNAYVYVQSQAGANIVWSGDVLPSIEEGWVSREFVVPATVASIRLGVRFNRVSKGNTVFLNTIEMYKYDSKNGSIESASSFEYQYHIKDHLGNVRLTFTTAPEVQTEIATLETALRVEEGSEFQRYDNARRVLSSLLDHTNGATAGWSQRLNGSTNEKYGLARSLSVMPGDTVHIEVFGKYIDPDKASWTGSLTSLLALISRGAPSVISDGLHYATSGSSFPYAGYITSRDDAPGPKAYLNWLIFDSKDSLIDSGYKRLTSVAREYGQNVAHERLVSPALFIREPGLVYTWVSNEETTPLEVYFDDFKVTHSKGPVIQLEDYYPFGLTFNSYQREGSMDQRYKYNGKEEQDELDLGWLDFGRRMYDPVIGKFTGVDPLASKYHWLTPYNYAENSPIANIDLWGLQRYFAADGSQLGQVGDNTDVRVVNSGMTNQQAIAHIQSGSAESAQALTNGSVAFADYFQTVADVTNDAALQTYSNNNKNCFTAAVAQLADAGVTQTGSADAIHTTVNAASDPSLVENSFGGAIRVQTELNVGNPVMVGVKETKTDGTVPDPGNTNSNTGHFIVIRSIAISADGTVSFNYLDNAKASTGKSANNNLILNTTTGKMIDNTTPGGRIDYSQYEVSEVRKNN